MKGTTNKGLVFTADGTDEKVSLSGYADAECAGDVSTRKFMSGYFLKIFGGVIGGRSKRQPVVALSTTEAEERKRRHCTVVCMHRSCRGSSVAARREFSANNAYE